LFWVKTTQSQCDTTASNAAASPAEKSPELDGLLPPFNLERIRQALRLDQTADEILASVARFCQRTSVSEH